MQPLGTKKSRNLSGQKNYTTSRNNKKSSNLLGQKISCNLSGQKNHASSRDKEITLSKGHIASKLVHKSENLLKMAPNLS